MNIKKNLMLRGLLKIFLISFAIFAILRIVDFLLVKNNLHPFSVLFSDDIGNLTNTLGGLGEVVTAILGIEITVIAIVVQLAANKYSAKIMDLFIEDKVNIAVISLYVITGINTIIIANTVNEKAPNLFSVVVIILLISLSLMLILPHFSYVFYFLKPSNFLKYIQKECVKLLKEISRKGNSLTKEEILNYKNLIKQKIDFVGDIALNSAFQADRAVTLYCLSTLKEILTEYQNVKQSFPEGWFKFSKQELEDPDFSSFSFESISFMEKNRTYFERKIFHIYEIIFNNSKTVLRDVASGVLQNSLAIATSAFRNRDFNALENCITYFNTFLRISIRDKDPRSAFNTLEYYRNLAEILLFDKPEIVERISEHFKYYGQEANKLQVLFILETAAHDLCKINQIAFEINPPNLEKLLGLFLTLDEPVEESTTNAEISKKEVSLIGVRIAQVKLAGYYLLNNREDLAKIIYNDMRGEPISRIQHIKEIIDSTDTEEFWEVTSRGVNFYYVKPEIRNALKAFWGWFA